MNLIVYQVDGITLRNYLKEGENSQTVFSNYNMDGSTNVIILRWLCTHGYK